MSNMHRIAGRITEYLVENEIINKEQTEEYAYGLEVFGLKTVNYGTIVVLAIIMHKLIPTLFFMVSYVGLRGRTGGYHSRSAIRCYFGTVAIYIGVVFVSEILLINHLAFMYALSVVSIACIIRCAPVNNENLCLSKSEMKLCRKRSCIYVIGISIGACAFQIMGINPVYIVYLLLGIILDAGLLIIEVTKERRVSV